MTRERLEHLQQIHDLLVRYAPNEEACFVLQTAIDHARQQKDRISYLAALYIAESIAGGLLAGRL